MFADLKNLAAFNALASTASLHEAIEVADAGASELLLRLSVAELDGAPDDAVAGLVREAARRVKDIPRFRFVDTVAGWA